MIDTVAYLLRRRYLPFQQQDKYDQHPHPLLLYYLIICMFLEGTL